MTEFERVDYDVVPKDNIHIPFLRNTLVNNGADWSTAPIPNVNYLPNYFNKWAKINKWSRNKPVVNSAEKHEQFDFPENFRSTPDGNEQYGLIYTKNQDWTDIHEIGWKYNSQEDGFPLRLADFKGYYPKARVPVSVYTDNWWQNRKTYVKIHKVNSTERQLSLDDFDMFEGGETYYFGFVVNNHVMTVPQTETMEFDFSPAVNKNDLKAKVTAILHPQEIKEWTDLGSVNKLYKPISLPEFEGLEIDFEMHEFISNISLHMETKKYNCGPQSIIRPGEQSVQENTMYGKPPKELLEGFRYRAISDMAKGNQQTTYNRLFNPSEDLDIHSDRYTYRIYIGDTFGGYNALEHYEEGRRLRTYVYEIGPDNIQSSNAIGAFSLIMSDTMDDL